MNSEKQEPIIVRFEKETEKSQDNMSTYIKSLNDELRILREILVSQDLRYKNNENTIPRNIVTNSIQTPQYMLPANVEGYTPVPFIGVTDSNCPKRKLHKDEPLTLQFKVIDDSLLKRITPLYFDILRKTSKTSVTEVFSQQFEIKDGLNIIHTLVNIPVGNYELSYGFFFRNELNDKFPSFYSKNCEIKYID